MTDRVTVRVDSELIDALDRFRADSAPAFRTRQDLLRYIIAEWLENHGYPSVRPMDLSSRSSVLEDRTVRRSD